jgi:hypothetical protein
MRRTAATLTLVSAILLLAPVPMPFASIVNAEVSAEMPAINVLSPIWKTVYHSLDIMLSFTVTTPQSWSEVFPGYSGGVLYWRVGAIKSVRYSVDGKDFENTAVNDDLSGLTIGPSSRTFNFSFNLTGLSDGQHDVTVNVFGSYKAEDFNSSRSPIIFFVDTTPLEVKILSPQSNVYNSTEIPLSVTTSEPASWMGYRLDEGDRVTLTENTTLKNVSAGSHNLTLFANDTIGNSAFSETVKFDVAEPELASPTHILPVAASIAVVAIVIVTAGSLLYNRKRRTEATQK